MQKVKNLGLTVLVSLLLFSCGEYQKVLNKGAVEDKYKMAVKLYESKKYDKALRLFEMVTPAYRGKPQMERIQFMVAQSNFNVRNYTLSGYYFDSFVKSYPKSSKKEESAFLSAYSYKLASPIFSLDQTDTYKALESFQTFINTYPNSTRIEDANIHYNQLRQKLEKKEFEIAKTYYRTAATDFRNYEASITAFENLISDYLGTIYKEEALFYILKARYDLVTVSTKRRKLGRVSDVIKAYDKLIKFYPETKFKEDSDKMLAYIKEQQDKLPKI